MSQNNPMSMNIIDEICLLSSSGRLSWRNEADTQIANLIRSTLEAAGERVCAGCKERAPFETCQRKDATCWTKEAILEPLNKE